MTLYDYVAYKNPQGAREVIRYYGLRTVPDDKVTARQLAACVQQRGQEALDKIADVHPDKNLIESRMPSNTHSNACGCSSANGWDNADGQGIKSDVKSKITDKSELLITGGIVLIGLALVLKLMK